MITVGFSTHRLEMLGHAETLMRRHAVIALEEPPHAGFEAMLRGEMSIEEYLGSADYEFPRFAKACCLMYRRLHAMGKRLIQVDPFMEHLYRLHDFFADGGDIQAVDAEDPARAVYDVERKATAALLHFYATSLTASFPDVVRLVIRFARADAARIALRDAMRAEGLASVYRPGESMYVECGYIHWKLFRDLQRRIGSKVRVRPCFVLQREARDRLGKKQILGPGDRLTLLLVFHPKMRGPLLDLLAARSLIYIKLLYKEEMEPTAGTYPHTDDEADAYHRTRGLSWEACEYLWPWIRRQSPEDVRKIMDATNLRKVMP